MRKRRRTHKEIALAYLQQRVDMIRARIGRLREEKESYNSVLRLEAIRIEKSRLKDPAL